MDPAKPDFPTVHRRERESIRRLDGKPLADGQPQAGLAFSGGGIRSATFCLGILQALAELRLLGQFDYLSSVSGGGYIAGWLSAFIHRQCGGQVEVAEAQLQTGGAESPAIRFLRSYSNYLTPKASLLAADSLTAIATYVRNLVLNLTLLLLALGGVLLVPRLLVWLAGWGHVAPFAPHHWQLLVGGGLVLILFAMVFIGLNLSCMATASKTPPWYTRQGWVLVLVVAPTLLSAWLVSFGFYGAAAEMASIGIGQWLGIGMVVYVCPWALGWWLGRWLDRKFADRPRFRPMQLVGMIAYAAFAGALGGVLLAGFARLSVVVQEQGYSGAWIASALSCALLLEFYSLTVVAHIGLMGRGFSNETREWWSRLGGWLLLCALVWATLFAAVYLAPAVFYAAPQWLLGSGLLAWLTSTATGVVLGRSPKSATDGENNWRDAIAKFMPYVFVIGLLGLLSFCLHLLLLALACGNCALHGHFADAGFRQILAAEAEYFQRPGIGLLAALCAGSLLLAAVLARRIDVNLFSIYHFYRLRLTRCYLGASRAQARSPHPFTGFDPADDLPLATLADTTDGGVQCQRPYPIHNTALNLVAGKQLAWQDRRAAAFALSPLFCGYGFVLPDEKGQQVEHFRPTAGYLGGLCLGSAIAMSGAAASPNMGYHSSPALTFLMTLFNVRLGHWSGNPAHAHAWRSDGPAYGGSYLIRELLGLTDYLSPYVYLSDGGHFENLGIYELVRRRCATIVAVDAAQDGTRAFDDLGNAVRRCYADFGVTIDIRTDKLQSDYAAIGRILYPDAPAGTLVYIKPTLRGDEPADLQNYQRTCPDFPHQSTADQWFDDAQFESYRKLGHRSGRAVFDAPLANANARNLDQGALAGVTALLREAAGLGP